MTPAELYLMSLRHIQEGGQMPSGLPVNPAGSYGVGAMQENPPLPDAVGFPPTPLPQMNLGGGMNFPPGVWNGMAGYQPRRRPPAMTQQAVLMLLLRQLLGRETPPWYPMTVPPNNAGSFSEQNVAQRVARQWPPSPVPQYRW